MYSSSKSDKDTVCSPDEDVLSKVHEELLLVYDKSEKYLQKSDLLLKKTFRNLSFAFCPSQWFKRPVRDVSQQSEVPIKDTVSPSPEDISSKERDLDKNFIAQFHNFFQEIAPDKKNFLQKKYYKTSECCTSLDWELAKSIGFVVIIGGLATAIPLAFAYGIRCGVDIRINSYLNSLYSNNCTILCK